MRATKITSVKLTKNFKPEMIKQLTPPFKAAAKLMEKEAKRLVPVDTGRLRDSIQAVVQFGGQAATKGANIVPINIELRATAPYAPFVEYGTGNRGRTSYRVSGGFAGLPQKPLDYTHGTVQGVRAQPFIRPAMIKAVKAMQIGRL